MNTDQHLRVGEIDVEIVRKKIKNLHLGVYPPHGRVRVAAPPAVSDEAIRLAVVTRMGWIKRQQAKFSAQARQSARDYVSGETHFHFGTAYRLKVINRQGASSVKNTGDRIELSAPPGSDRDFRERVFQRWQRKELRDRAGPLVDHWAGVYDVAIPELGIKRMRTKWGTCNAAVHRIWLNLELAKKPLVCIDYLVCHEVAHFIEGSHGDRFIALMDLHMPRWRVIRAELNSEPLGHEEWDH
ncbi:M48 family metallopeptidase [Gluconobacter oxydans]|uniref:M48 family metallopeptidase n=1 Tax=Gluconobacter oxydans TaxID=442 RepID=UPI00209CB08D|nr:SprT family zinc-dependent metalloprotease [Gluconobacter oxydans]MCP1249913.1 M48 family metallopeptidase [Gluconobacter oxydans]